jgi:hypothetical protein
LLVIVEPSVRIDLAPVDAAPVSLDGTTNPVDTVTAALDSVTNLSNTTESVVQTAFSPAATPTARPASSTAAASDPTLLDRSVARTATPGNEATNSNTAERPPLLTLALSLIPRPSAEQALAAIATLFVAVDGNRDGSFLPGLDERRAAPRPPAPMVQAGEPSFPPNEFAAPQPKAVPPAALPAPAGADLLPAGMPAALAAVERAVQALVEPLAGARADRPGRARWVAIGAWLLGSAVAAILARPPHRQPAPALGEVDLREEGQP